jgi:hypothetical protein
VESSREYLGLIRGARHEVLNRTGHLGVVLRPERFAKMVVDFGHAAPKREEDPSSCA